MKLQNNLDKFHYIINFDNFENDLKKYLSNFETNEEILINHSNKSNYKKMSNQEKELIESYNYWDIKLLNTTKINHSIYYLFFENVDKH